MDIAHIVPMSIRPPAMRDRQILDIVDSFKVLKPIKRKSRRMAAWEPSVPSTTFPPARRTNSAYLLDAARTVESLAGVVHHPPSLATMKALDRGSRWGDLRDEINKGQVDSDIDKFHGATKDLIWRGPGTPQKRSRASIMAKRFPSLLPLATQGAAEVTHKGGNGWMDNIHAPHTHLRTSDAGCETAPPPLHHACPTCAPWCRGAASASILLGMRCPAATRRPLPYWRRRRPSLAPKHPRQGWWC